MDDLISSQGATQAINLLKDLEQRLDDYYGLNDKGKSAFRMAITALELFGNSEQLPSAQPEIIHCGDCKYKDDGIDEDGIPFLKCLNGRSYGGTRMNDYCSWAERRQDE